MQQTIVPDKQSVESCLKDKSYHVDFYQREYVWSKETVETLLNDIFYHFNLGYEQHKESEITPGVIEQYNWYYLNVYITNRIADKNYIVDGQQRLSTLTLIATKLYHKLSIQDNLRALLGQCIFSNGGFENVFNLDHNKRCAVMECIFNAREYKETFKNKTEENLVSRYGDISNYIDHVFKHGKEDSKKLRSFALYFLKRLVLVELSTTQENMPMVFEVINDRGEALKPFEILKGKLIGALNKEDTESFCDKWDKALLRLSKWENDFFIDLIKSKFVFTRNSSLEKNINNQYHRYIFADNDIARSLALRPQDPNRMSNIKRFIDQDVAYYTELYAKIRKNENKFLFYANKINRLDGQYQLILSACEINDKNESQKIEIIAKEYDRFWMLLNLNGSYDSNDFQELSYNLNQLLKNADVGEYENIFDDLLKKEIKEKNDLAQVHSVLEYESFKARNRNMNRRFLLYLFARVEKFICEQINQAPQDSVLEIATKKGKDSYQIEHILSRNETNIGYFESEEEFESQRNLLGGLLLLKGKVNVSSGNEEFQNKLKTYSSSLVWGHCLCQDFYHKTNKDFLEFNQKLLKKTGIQFKPYSKFDKSALEERTRLLYEIVKMIWEVER